MAGITPLRKLQFGAEATAGTEVAATTIWRGLGALNDETEVQYSEETVGLIAPTLRSYISKKIATLSMPETECTFEQFPYVLQAGVDEVTPVADTGTGETWTWAMAQATLNTIKTYTIEGGNNQQEEQMLYSFVREFGLSGAAGEALMMSAVWEGRKVDPGTFTPALSLPQVFNVPFPGGGLYIDPVSGSFGATQVSNALVGFSLNVTTGVHASYTIDTLEFSAAEYGSAVVECELRFKHVAALDTEIANMRAETPRLVRVEFIGPALGTPGTETNKRLTIDIAGKWATVSPLESENDDEVRALTFRGGYDETAADFMTIEIVNELAALP